MTTLAQSETDEIAICGTCQSAFADLLAWCAHRPWKSITHRDGCKWPRALRKVQGIWSLRPSCRKAVEIAENGPPEAFRIKWPTLTLESKNGRKLGYGPTQKTEPYNHAGFRASLSAECEGRE